MAAGEIKIRIGALQDRSVDVVFGNIEKRANQLRDNLIKSLGGSTTSKGAEKLGKDIDKALTGAAKSGEKAAKKIQTDQERAAKAVATAHAKAQKDIERALASATRVSEREAAKQSAITERESRRQVRIREKFAERTGYRATRFLFPPPSGIIGGARRVAGDILRGAGVDLSISGGVGRTVALQGAAVQIANQERIATGKSKGANFYANAARETGAERSVDPNDVIGMVNQFVGKTGAFDEIGKMQGKLTSLGTASGSNLTELGDAAGYVYNQLKDLPDAGDKTIEVLRGIIGQTAIGAVNMPDYAKQLGRIAANASKFEGTRGDNISKLSAFAQLSIESGGASSPADAARSTGALADNFGKAARLKAFKKTGIKVFTDDSETLIRDPIEIIKDAFRKTKGNIPKMADLFASTIGRKPVTALGNSYIAAGGGEAGIAAVQAKYDSYRNAQLTPETEKKNNEDFANSPAAKAQRFQNNLDKVMASAADKVFPALEKLAPPALAVADALGKLVGYVAENPIRSVVLALVAAVGRAGLESALRAAIEKQIMGSNLFPGRGLSPEGTPLPAGSPGNVWGTRAGKALTALGMGTVGYSVGGAIGGAIGGESGAQTGSLIGGGALLGASLGGLPGAVIGATVGGVTDQAMSLGNVTEGIGGFGALLTGGFTGLDEYQNKKAKERRVAQDAAESGGANAPGAVSAADLSRGVADGMELERSR